MPQRTLSILFLLATLSTVALVAQNCPGTGAGSCCTAKETGQCFKVHGKYAIYVENNGIWITQTKKLLTTAGDGDLDDKIYAAGDWQDYALSGDFTVCSSTKYRYPARHRQYVCIQSYKNIKVVKRP